VIRNVNLSKYVINNKLIQLLEHEYINEQTLTMEIAGNVLVLRLMATANWSFDDVEAQQHVKHH
jgi:hypothetical protein